MSFSFQPKSEEEVLNLLKPSTYDFLIKQAENAVSKKGNSMIKLTVVVYDEQARERYITDYLMEAMLYKVKHFCDATGLEEKYQQGKFDAMDCINRTGKCKVRIEESDGYAPKNSIQDYLKSEKNNAPVNRPHLAQVAKDPVFDNDVPF
jgi:hypothetical protein